MTAHALIPGAEPTGSGSRRTAAGYVGITIEAVVLALVCLAPWGFGATTPKSIFLLSVGVAALLILWGMRALLAGTLVWHKCPVAGCLALMILIGVWQVLPLPGALLRRVSPATARMYDQLLPARPERPSLGEPKGALLHRPGATISVDPGSTRRGLARLLLGLLLFLVVRNNITPEAGLRRLSFAATANGAILAMFGLVQFFSSDAHTLYWAFPTAGSPFGPFVNRNHFAFYVNVCAGLGAGLLLSAMAGRNLPLGGPTSDTPGVPHARRGGRGGGGSVRPGRLTVLLLDPAVLGMSVALGLMMSSIVFCLSRGGFLALAGGLLLGLVLWLARPRRSHGGEAVVLAIAVSMALVCWFGYERVETRLATLRGGAELRIGRLAIWSRAMLLMRDFPLWGTGYGTYEFADTLHRTDAMYAGMIVDHAHNDYLEMLVEGGLTQLILGVLAAVLVFRLGLRAARHGGGRPAGGLALGALVGLATVLIHSVFDFGMHIPACAALVVVLCAHVCGLGGEAEERGRAPSRGRLPADREREDGRTGQFVLALGVGSMLAVAPAIVHEGWRPYRSRNLRVAASDLDRSLDPERLERKADRLEEAARLVPEDARLRADLARAHLTVYEQRMYELEEDAAGDGTDPPGSASIRRGPDAAAVTRLRREHMLPALRHYLRSRDLSPLRAEVHMEIAELVNEFATAEPRGAYLARAKRLAPGDPDLWYRCGILELADGQPDRAWASWRHSLALSDLHRREILARGAERLGPLETLRRILPDRPDLLLEAATSFYPTPDDGRRPFLERALSVLDGRTGPPTAADLHVKATIHRALGQRAEALSTYRAALSRNPMQMDWRLELAELSQELGQFEESRQELLAILALQPKAVRARKLLEAVTLKILEGNP